MNRSAVGEPSSRPAAGHIVIPLCIAVAQAFTLPPNPACAFPAFARKYGLACTGCHEAWPTLNDVGRTFRDNGYQMLLGVDEPAKSSPAYWPVSVRITPHYEFDSADHQGTDQGTRTLSSGGIATIGMDLLTGGTLAKDVSFLVVPTGFTSDEGVTLEAAWIRFDNILASSWINLKLGKHEVDLPRSGHRSWSLTDTGYLIYGYHAPGSVSLYDLAENQSGIEYVGHDRGSFTRLALSVFNVESSPGSRNAFQTPGGYAHASYKRLFERRLLSAVRLGVFGSYTTWPTSFLTNGGQPIDGTGRDLKRASKYGIDWHVWFGPAATPLHAILVAVRGEDSPGLIPSAVRDGTFDGGFVEIGFTPTLRNTLFGRADAIRNRQQANPTTPKTFRDEDAYTVGVRHTIEYSTRAEFALHAEYSTRKTRDGADDGSDLRTKSVFLGVDFAY